MLLDELREDIRSRGGLKRLVYEAGVVFAECKNDSVIQVATETPKGLTSIFDMPIQINRMIADWRISVDAHYSGNLVGKTESVQKDTLLESLRVALY